MPEHAGRMSSEPPRPMSLDEVVAALTAFDPDAVPPDDAPPCDADGCDRLGVIAQSVTWAGRGTQWSHWCVTHDPVAYSKLVRCAIWPHVALGMSCRPAR